jgi:hypothetical protein
LISLREKLMISLIAGGITHHYIASHLKYCNRINNSGTIVNEYFILSAGTEEGRLGLLKGKDSACGDIYGAMVFASVNPYLDFVVGGYNTNFDAFRRRKMHPVVESEITPVIGVNFRIPLYTSKDFSVNIENLISYGITTHGIGVTFN